jgi:O-antigen/teichoic acid export membrane protein
VGSPVRGLLLRNTAWIGAGQAIRTVVQALYFILMARALGTNGYGAFVGVVSLVAITTPFATLGTGNLLVKHVARDASTFAWYWGKALATTLIGGTLLLGLITVSASALLPRSIPVGLIVAVGAADLIFARLVDVSGFAFQAVHRMDRTALMQLLVSPLRLLAAGILIATNSAPTAVEWGWLYLVSSVVGGCVAVACVSWEMGRPRFDLRGLGSEAREGTFFSVSLSAQTIYNDIDKAMLARLATLAATGVYAAGYRVVDIAFLPIGAVISASYARFFQHGVLGVRATARYARRLLRLGVAWGLLAGVGLYLLAPTLPLILGGEYRDSVGAVRWLAVLPLLKAVHYFGANALTGAGHQGVRTAIQLGIALANVLLCFWLIPLYSWPGAAAATLASDGLLAVGMWVAVYQIGRKEAPRWTDDQVAAAAEAR